MKTRASCTGLLLATTMIGLSACSQYVKKADYDAMVSEMRSRDSALESRIDANRAAIDQLRQDMESRLSAHDARIAELAGRLHVDMNVHFAYDAAELRDADKTTLDAFSKVIREHHDSARVTVEGFTDPAGSVAYNRGLGNRRADAVRDYLIGTGLNADRITTVSYGESSDRQMTPGAWGDSGLANRRVSLVVDLPPQGNS